MQERTPSQAILRTLTFPAERPDNLILLDNTIACDGGYSCPCLGCELDRQRALKRGVRPSQPLPIKQRKAA